jgi:hypothetical protein
VLQLAGKKEGPTPGRETGYPVQGHRGACAAAAGLAAEVAATAQATADCLLQMPRVTRWLPHASDSGSCHPVLDESTSLICHEPAMHHTRMEVKAKGGTASCSS